MPESLTGVPEDAYEWLTQQKQIAAVKRKIRDSKTSSTADRYSRGADNFLEWLSERGIDPFNAVSRDFRIYMQELIEDDYAYGSLQPRLYGAREFYRCADELHEEQQELLEIGRELSNTKIPEVSDPTESHSLGDFNISSESKQAEELAAADEHHKLTQEQINQLADNVQAPKPRNSLIIRLMYQCCLRRGELARLKSDDINQGERTINVPAVKGNKGREIPIPYRSKIDERLSLWIKVERKGVAKAAESDYLFPTQRSERISTAYVSDIIREAAKHAPNIEQETLYVDKQGRKRMKIHGHTLRASGAHRYWDKSSDIYFVSKILGHSDVDTTERYLDVDKEEIVSKARENW